MRAFQRKSGIWECKGYEDGRRKSYYGKTKEEAEGKARSEPIETLHGYFAKVFVPAIRHSSPETKRLYVTAFDKWWLPRLGQKELSAITRADVQRVVNQMHGLSASTVRQYVSKLSQVFKLAQSDGAVGGNPAATVRLPRMDTFHYQPLKAWELRSLLESVDGPIWNLVVLCGFFGLRVGEACGPLMSNSKEIDVRRQWPDQPLKSVSSRRTLPIPPSCEFRRSGPYLVGMSPHEVRKILRPMGFCPHELRHTFNTVLEWDLSCPRPMTVALMGHSGSVTQVYSHPDPKVLESWLERFWAHVSTSGTTESWRMEG